MTTYVHAATLMILCVNWYEYTHGTVYATTVMVLYLRDCDAVLCVCDHAMILCVLGHTDGTAHDAIRVYLNIFTFV